MNWFKKHWKSIATVSILSCVVIASATILFWPEKVNSSSVYILKFDKNKDKDADAKNNVIKTLINKTRNALDQYEVWYKQQYREDFPGLNFQYVNLKTTQTNGEKNFFINLDKSLKAIDSRLGITNIQRTPETLNEGFYNKNTELLSFYWSPDYNGVGTWLKYMISDAFSMPNFWPSIYQAIEKNNQEWANSLGQELKKYTFDGKQSIFLNQTDLLAWVNSSINISKISLSDAYVTIANVIGKWVKDNSNIDINLKEENGKQVFENYSNVGLGIKFVNFIASNPSNIPFVEDGPWTQAPWLVRNGFYKQINPNSDNNYRDWFYDASENKSSTIRLWDQNNPFNSNKTPFNPAFSNAPNSSFFQSCWTGLTTWTTIGDENSKALPYEGAYLVANGANNNLNDLINEFNTNQTMTFNIRPIPWIDIGGNQVIQDGKQMFLSPEDFIASIKAYIRSIDCGLNTNNYFINLLGLDVQKTISDNNNLKRNTSALDNYQLKLYFNNPTLSASDCLDILQKQYFCAIPAFKQTVKNIINDSDWKKSAVLTSNGLLNTTETKMENFYGSGDWRKTWNDWVFTSPYYISNITEQNIVYKINKNYFNTFTNNLSSNQYKSFILENNFNGSSIRKFDKIELKYAGSYNENILFEQFKSNELDVSTIQAANLVNVAKNFPKDMYYVNSMKINRSDLIGYNLQIYEKDFQNVILGQNNKAMKNNDGAPTYSIDEWGNYKFNEGEKPKLKSRISKSYADLIVKDFFTPIEEGGVSQLLRTTINTCINWVSLQTIVNPGITKSIQYSFMPFGVYQLDATINPDNNFVGNVDTQLISPFNETSIENIAKYWYFSSSKLYMTQDELSVWNEKSFLLRRSGSIIWTYKELLYSMI